MCYSSLIIIKPSHFVYLFDGPATLWKIILIALIITMVLQKHPENKIFNINLTLVNVVDNIWDFKF